MKEMLKEMLNKAKCALNWGLGTIVKITSFPRLRFSDKIIGDGKPRIYIVNSTCSRDAVATLSALNAAKPCMLVSEEQYRSDNILQTVDRRRMITAAGGLDTEWLHNALRRLNNGESLLIFPEERTGGIVTALNPMFILLSLLSGAEIIPLYNSPKRILFRRQDITAGKPLLPDSRALLTATMLEKESERVRSAMARLAGI